MGESVLSDELMLYEGADPARSAKGDRVKIPELGLGCGRQRKRAGRRRREVRGELSFLFNSPPAVESV